MDHLLSNLFYKFHHFISTLNTPELIVNIGEIIVLALLGFFLYRKYIKGTNSENLIRGVLVLLFMWILAEFFLILGLRVFGMVLRTFVAIVIFSLIVIFQPELRRFLVYLGQGNLISRVFLARKQKTEKEEGVKTVKELIETIKYLSRNKIGALIVLNSCEDCTSYDIGTTINADITQELLLTIFHPNTPLHDGAVVVSKNKISSAGVLLPLTEDPKLSWRYGTRHRAALGASETSDCAVIVVSEETGDVSIAIDGELKKYEDLGQLKSNIEKILMIKSDEIKEKRNFLFDFKNKQDKNNQD
ncbi:MAG: TIGR00159 family protein [Cyanobacteria bacterium SIG30]|nr:TIGR00159 family protein [Cyanobacteria bacterium SIG30]